MQEKLEKKTFVEFLVGFETVEIIFSHSFIHISCLILVVQTFLKQMLLILNSEQEI